MIQPVSNRANVDLTQAVFSRSVSVQEYIALLKSALERKYPEPTREQYKIRLRYHDHCSAIALFNEFLQSRDTEQIQPDETLLSDFETYLTTLKPDASPKYVQALCSRIRCLTNDFPVSLLQRELATTKQTKSHARYKRLTPETQEMLNHFKRDGRKTKWEEEWQDDGTILIGKKKPELTVNLLSDMFRQNIVYDAMRFLDVVGKNDLRQVTAKDAEAYLAHFEQGGKRESAVNRLSGMKSLYQNLWALGFVTANPFRRYGRRIIRIDPDYVPEEGVAVLGDLSTLNRKSFKDVRDRLIAYGLCYDFALRRGEASLLLLPDVCINEYMELTLRSDVQKGQGKPTITLFSFFPQTVELMRLYLQLRKQIHPDTDRLLVNLSGKPLDGDGTGEAVRDCCRALGVTTCSGKLPSAHRLRHSLGTLNAESLGRGLSLGEIMDRLRHTDVKLTRNTYITNNPLLRKQKHDAIMERNGCRAKVSKDATSLITESEAVRLLQKFQVTVEGLRDYGRQNGLLIERTGAFFYSLDAITALTTNYLTKTDAMRITGLKKSGFFWWVGSKGIPVVRIGKACLIPKDDAVGKAGGK